MENLVLDANGICICIFGLFCIVKYISCRFIYWRVSFWCFSKMLLLEFGLFSSLLCYVCQSLITLYTLLIHTRMHTYVYLYCIRLFNSLFFTVYTKKSCMHLFMNSQEGLCEFQLLLFWG